MESGEAVTVQASWLPNNDDDIATTEENTNGDDGGTSVQEIVTIESANVLTSTSNPTQEPLLNQTSAPRGFDWALVCYMPHVARYHSPQCSHECPSPSPDFLDFVYSNRLF